MKSILKKYFKAFILFLAVAAGLFLYYENSKMNPIETNQFQIQLNDECVLEDIHRNAFNLTTLSYIF